MKNLLLLLGVCFTSVFSFAQTDLFFSEYAEGSGNNKAVEIYNPTSQAIDLNNYWVVRFSNGSSVFTEGGLTHLAGNIEPYHTFVLVNGQTTSTPTSPACSPVLQAMADQLDGVYPAPMYMNGNDAIGLIKTPNGETPNGTNITAVDLIGQIGLGNSISAETGWSYVQDSTLTYNNSSGDPVTGKVINYIVQSKATDNVTYGPYWMSWTSDHSIIRRPNIIQGVVINPVPFVVNQQWDTVPARIDTATGYLSYKDIWDNLGSHYCVANFSADFSADITTLCKGEMVTFGLSSATNNYDSLLWDFSSGTPSTSTEPEPVIEYAYAGNFDVTLKVFLGNNSATIAKQNFIHVLSAPEIPNKPEGDTLVCFNDLISLYTTNITSGVWSLSPSNAGNINTYDNICEIYWNELYIGESVLKVNNVNLCGVSFFSDELTILKTNAINIGVEKSILVCFGESKILNPQISGGTPPYSYLWEPNYLFDDPSSATPIISPINSTNIQLTITDRNNCTKTETFSVTVEGGNYNLAYSAFPVQFSSPPFNVQFDNLTPNQNNFDFIWYFGNGDSSYLTQPNYTYTKNGLYTISLIAISKSSGCSDILIKEDLIICTGSSGFGDTDQIGLNYWVSEEEQLLNLSFENQPEGLYIQILDLFGREYFSSIIRQRISVVNLEELVPGMYLFVIRKNNYVTGGKFILTK